MHTNPERPNLDLISRINRERQAELQQAARQERALRAVNLSPQPGHWLQWLEAGLDKAGHYLRVELEHLRTILRPAKQPKPAIKHRHG